MLLKHGHDAVRRSCGRRCSTPSAASSGRWRSIGELNFVSMLPKTRSGKIMRRVLKAVILDRDPGDITTIEDEGSVDEARQAWRSLQDELERGRQPAPGTSVRV